MFLLGRNKSNCPSGIFHGKKYGDLYRKSNSDRLGFASGIRDGVKERKFLSHFLNCFEAQNWTMHLLNKKCE